MKYLSTRNVNKKYSFIDTLLKSMPNDGGLFIPEFIPKVLFKKRIFSNYYNLICHLLSLYMTKKEYNKLEIKKITKYVYKKNSCFFYSSPQKLKKINKNYILDLNYGKTLSFKDFSMPFLVEVLCNYLKKIRNNSNAFVATSGDTGGSCSFYSKKKKNLKTFIFFPKNKISEFQNNQILSVTDKNIFNLSIEGNFDDCQTILKSNIVYFKNIITFNSVNFLRIIIQSSYYLKTSYDLYKKYKKKINFSIPSGNFGNAFSAFLAKKNGAKIGKIIVSTNENDILYYFFNKSIFLTNKSVKKTNCPSMDISKSSNLERFIYFSFSNLKKIINKKKYKFKKKLIIKSFRCLSKERNKEIKNYYKKNGKILDTHTCNSICSIKNKKGIWVVINTAKHIKFSEFTNKIIGIKKKYKFNEKIKFLKKKSFFFKSKDKYKIKNFISINRN
ncbi:threonine synthase [Candidatus Vidania fulgoroideorum]